MNPVRKRSCRKVMFSQACVKNSYHRRDVSQRALGRGCLSQHALVRGWQTPPGRHPLGRHPLVNTPWVDTPWTDTPLGRHTTPGRHLPGKHPPGQTPPWTDTPLGKHPPGRHTPLWQTPPCADTPAPVQTPPPNGHYSGRYASYWNTFSFNLI